MVYVSSQETSLRRMFSVLLILGILSVSSAIQQLVVMHAPKYVTFQQQTAELQKSQLPRLVENTLGVKSNKDLRWQGMVQGSVFKKPKANVMLTVEVPESLEDKPLDLKSVAKFPVKDDFPFVDMESVRNSIQRTFLDQDPLMMDMLTDNKMFDLRSGHQLFRNLPNSLHQVKERLLDSDSVVKKIKSGSLNSSLTPDMTLIGEMQMVADVVKTMTDDLKTLYKDNVVVEVFLTTLPKGHSRKARSLMADTTPNPTPTPIEQNKPGNLSGDYGDLFPAIFNIILWMMILLAVAVYAIVYGIWFMDPGRESIIYRMTSPRLKKD